MNFNASQSVNFDVIMDMILRTGGETITVTLHTERKFECKRKGEGTVSRFTEPVEKLYRISFFKTRRIGIKTSVLFGYK